MRVGGKAAIFEGFTHTGKDVDSLQVEDELKQDCKDPDFILRNVNLAFSCASQAPRVAEGYLRRKEVQRLICSQCLFVSAFVPFIFRQMVDVDRKTKKFALSCPLIGIVGAGGQLGTAITNTLLEFGWKPHRLAIAGRGKGKLRKFEEMGVCVFDNAALLAKAVRLIVVAVGPQHARQVGTAMGEGGGTPSRLVFSTLTGISEASLKRLLGTEHLLQATVEMASLEVAETLGHSRHADASSSSSSGCQEREQQETQKFLGKILSTLSTSINETSSSSYFSSAPPADPGSVGAWQAVNDRASKQFFPDAQSAEGVLRVVEAFATEDGLETVQARQAARGWLDEHDNHIPFPPTYEPNGASQSDNNTPATTSPIGGFGIRADEPLHRSSANSLRAFQENDNDSRGSSTRSGGKHSSSGGTRWSGRGSAFSSGNPVIIPSPTREEAIASSGAGERGECSIKVSSVGATSTAAAVATATATSTTWPFQSSSGNGRNMFLDNSMSSPRDTTVHRRRHDTGKGDASAFKGGRATSTSFASDIATTFTTTTAMLSSPRMSPRYRRKDNGSREGEENESGVWLPTLDWPPPDLVDLEYAYEEVLLPSYRAAWRERLVS